MLKGEKGKSRRLAPAIVAGLASFMVLTSLFVAAMLNNYLVIDFSYLWFAVLRIMANSILVSAAALLIARYLRSLVTAALFGVVTGFMGGVAVVTAVTW